MLERTAQMGASSALLRRGSLGFGLAAFQCRGGGQRSSRTLSQPSLLALSASTYSGPEAASLPNLYANPAVASWPWVSNNILTSPKDRRTYRHVCLPNGLNVLVISDPKSNKAAAAMSVDVGAGSDTLPGIAHLLEHMLFLGSETHPTENAYKAYLAKHGGHSNASTAMDATVFQFEVGAKHLKGALDIFSGFFVCPLISENSTMREMKAVDAEDSKNRTNDERRILQVLKATADQSHWYSKYSTGNLHTLGGDVEGGEQSTRAELLDFHSRHYRSSSMSLAVLGSESLDELEEMAKSCFGSLGTDSHASKSQHVAQALIKEPWSNPWAADSLPLMVNLEPLKEMRRVLYQWPLPPVRHMYRGSPTRLLSHIWGNEGPGSLHSALTSRGWAQGLSAGLRTSHHDFSLFQVAIELTEEVLHVAQRANSHGVKNWDEVASMVQAYSSLVQSMPLSDLDWMWDEVRSMEEIHFRFAAETAPYSLVTKLARRLQLYPVEEVLSAGALLTKELDQQAMVDMLQYFTPANTLTWKIMSGESASHHSVEGAQELTEPWYGVPYSKHGPEVVLPLLEEWAGKVYPELSLPGRNEFIPRDFTLVSNSNGNAPEVPEKEGFEGSASGSEVSLEAELAARLPENPLTPEGALVPPALVEDGPHGQLWHKTDSSFKMPRTCISLVLATPVMREEGARAVVASMVLLDSMYKALAETTYAASVGGLNFGISRHHHGLLVEVVGFNEKAPELLRHVLGSLLSQDAVKEAVAKYFTASKGAVIRQHRNWSLGRPDAIASAYGRWALDDRPMVDDALAAAEALEPSDVEELSQKICAEVFPVCLIHGNMLQSQASEVWGSIKSLINAAGAKDLPEERFPSVKAATLPAGARVRVRAPLPNDSDENSAVVCYWQLNNGDEAEAVRKEQQLKALVLASLMKEPAFNELRTKQQLGYIVSSGMRGRGRQGDLTGMQIRVLSKTHAPDEVHTRIEEFLSTFRALLAAMTPAEFSAHINSLKVKYQEPPKTLEAEFSMMFAEVDSGALDWLRRVKRVEQLDSVTKDEILELFDNGVMSAEARRLDVLVYGKEHPMPQGGESDTVWMDVAPSDIKQWRSSLRYLPTSVPPHQAARRLSQGSQEQ